MARIFITGSADGLGQLSASLLITQGHQVVLHARNETRGREALKKTPEAETLLTGDLSIVEETINLAGQVNACGSFDAIIHNAGVYRDVPKQILSVNTLAPYILTSLVNIPKRLVYLSSGTHLYGRPNLESIRQNTDRISYADSKLHVVMLALAVSRKWPAIFSNAVDPGWVPTKMGGRSAPDDLKKGYETQAWLAVSDDEKAKVSGHYFYHQQQRSYNTLANDIMVQEKLLKLCEEMTGVSFPSS
jgi:NAD(P)-dependent dehydrogenase (short-subunit alcohol dehydrogenase family)